MIDICSDVIAEVIQALRQGVPIDALASRLGVTVAELRQAIGEQTCNKKPGQWELIRLSLFLRPTLGRRGQHSITGLYHGFSGNQL